MERNYSFGYWIRRRRKALDLTQEKLAQRVVCTLSMIKKIELDQRRPSRLMAERLADSLQIPTLERDAFIKVALSIHSPDFLNLEKEPITEEIPSQPETNLPIPATRMIGREEQIAEIIGLLKNPDVRMLTLTGPGGVGKTRLANHIASCLSLEFPEGVWLVELAPLSNPALVAQVILSTLGKQEASGKSPLVALASYLQQRRLLLLLDNCEHLLEACAHLAHALLSSCKQLVILCTSREALNIPEEYTWLVPPLALPDVKSIIPPDELLQIESVSLFMDRARHVLPSFKLTEQNSSAIVKICCQLDGLPLAIELAAARIRVLSPNQIVEKLDDANHLLDSGFRTADVRQQTMRAAIEWSFNSLSKPEQAMLRRLSVFAGSWTLEAAEEICSIDGQLRNGEFIPVSSILEREDVLALLNKLVNKSLVTAVRGQWKEMRYFLLETIRQYTSEKLSISGELEAVRQHHLEYYLAWVELIAPGLHGAQQVTWLKALDFELENLRLALTWSIESAPVAGLRLASALYRFWRMRNLYAEGADWLIKLLDYPENKAPTIYRAQALGVLCSLSIYTAHSPEVWASESLAISETLRDEPTRAFALWMLGSIHYLKYENFERGHLYLTKSLEVYDAIGDHWGMAQVLYHLANLAIFQGDAITQRTYLERCLVLYREVEDLHGIAASLDNLASAIADIEADLQTSQRLVEEALALYHQINTRIGLHNALYVYAYILAWRGEFQLARQILQERAEIVRQSGEPLNNVLSEVLIAGVDRLAGREEQALIVLEESLRTMRASDPRLVQIWHYSRTLHELSYILARRGKTKRASNLLQEALENCDVAEERALLFHCKGSVAIIEQNGAEALEDFLHSLNICKRSYFKLTAILALEGIAGALNLISAYEQATRLLSAATAFRSQIGAQVSPWDLPAHERLKAELADKMGKAAFMEAWEAGQAFPFDLAVEEALAIPSGLV